MHQDWIWGLIGGGLIGLGGAVYLLGNGRIMGASGILGGLLNGAERNQARERIAFLIGTFLLPLILVQFAGTIVTTHLTNNWFIVVLAGLLVGIGSRIANGCTSGHGVCGISRFSLRGIVATVFYILAGGLTLSIFRHLLGII